MALSAGDQLLDDHLSGHSTGRGNSKGRFSIVGQHCLARGGRSHGASNSQCFTLLLPTAGARCSVLTNNRQLQVSGSTIQQPR